MAATQERTGYASVNGLQMYCEIHGAGLPRSQLAVLLATTHITLVHRTEWLVSMIAPLMGAPLPEAR